MRVFLKSQGVAFAATLVDFCSLIFFTEIFKIWYVASTVLGAILGALTSFFLGRAWAFKSEEPWSDSTRQQALRYFFVFIGSVTLNALLVYFFTDFVKFDYRISKFLTAIAVGWFYNYPLHRWIVFKKCENQESIKNQARINQASQQNQD